MTEAQTSTTVSAGNLHPVFKVNDTDCALSEVYVINLQSQSFADAAAKMEKNSDKEPVTEICCRVFELLNFVGFKICFH